MIACAGSWLIRERFVTVVIALVVIAWVLGGIFPDICNCAMFCRKCEDFGSRVQLCNSVYLDWRKDPNWFNWTVFAFIECFWLVGGCHICRILRWGDWWK